MKLETEMSWLAEETKKSGSIITNEETMLEKLKNTRRMIDSVNESYVEAINNTACDTLAK